MKTIPIHCVRTAFLTFTMLSTCFVFAQKPDSTVSSTQPVPKKFTLKIGNDTVETEDQDIVVSDADICRAPAVPPKFNHPDFQNFAQWLRSNLRYPQICLENGSIGRVRFSFVITKNGYVTHPQLLQSSDRKLSEEVLRVLRLQTPKWTPARNNKNENVFVKYVFAVDFRGDPMNIQVMGDL